MSVEDNKRVVREFCDHFKKSNADGLIDAMTDDATWWVNGKPHLFPSSGTRTKEEAAKMFRNMLAAYADGLEMQIVSIMGEGDIVVAETRSHATTRTGRVYENEYALFFTVRHGKVAKVREYTDLLHVLEVFG